MAKIDLGFTIVRQELPNFVYEKLRNFSKHSNAYHHQPDELRELIAQKHGININSVSLTAGSDQAILLLCSLKGQSTHVFTPTYICYSDAEKFGHSFTEHQSLDDNNYSIDVSRIEGSTLIFIANPNNPAGITSREKILELVKNNPDSLVVVDEAYGEFAGESVVSDVADHMNLVVLRSFSKGYALAGFRIGYMIAHPHILGGLVLESTWFNVAYTSVGAAIAALENEGYFRKLREDIISERESLAQTFERMGLRLIKSHINAVLIKFNSEEEANTFVEFLANHEISVNQGDGLSNIGLDKTFVRISISTPEQMRAVKEVLSGYKS